MKQARKVCRGMSLERVEQARKVHEATRAHKKPTPRIALKPMSLCTLCEWPLRELLNENANMGIQNNYFVRKGHFSMGRNGGYGFKNSKKKIEVAARKNHRFSTRCVAMVAV